MHALLTYGRLADDFHLFTMEWEGDISEIVCKFYVVSNNYYTNILQIKLLSEKVYV